MNPFLKEKLLNFISSLVFLLALIATVLFAKKNQFSIVDIKLIDFIFIVLASYRIARMLVYEKVFSLIRYVLKINCRFAFFTSLNNLITCPWCTCVWVSLFVFDIFYFVPYGNYFIYILAISSVAAPLVLLSNYLSLRNDILKKERDK